jgi:hypothetical protein
VWVHVQPSLFSVLTRDRFLPLLLSTHLIANVDIKKKQQQQEAPTPQNTPIFKAPVNQPEHDMETIQTPGKNLFLSVFFDYQLRLSFVVVVVVVVFSLFLLM